MSFHTLTTLTEHVARSAARITPAELEDFTETARHLGDGLSLWNRFAIWRQRPGARHVAAPQTWREHGCLLLHDAQPLAIIRHGQVAYVYDVADVCSTSRCDSCWAEPGEECGGGCLGVVVLGEYSAQLSDNEAIALVRDLRRGTAVPG